MGHQTVSGCIATWWHEALIPDYIQIVHFSVQSFICCSRNIWCNLSPFPSACSETAHSQILTLRDLENCSRSINEFMHVGIKHFNKNVEQLTISVTSQQCDHFYFSLKTLSCLLSPCRHRPSILLLKATVRNLAKLAPPLTLLRSAMICDALPDTWQPTQLIYYKSRAF